jgi:hypothetical protein
MAPLLLAFAAIKIVFLLNPSKIPGIYRVIFPAGNSFQLKIEH